MSENIGPANKTDQETWNHIDLRELSEKHDFECWNCESPTTEYGECEVCGVEPYNGGGWEIECVECGTVAYGDQGQNVEHDMFMHRTECPNARFVVVPL
jgi:hypothetical protein